MCFDSNGLLFDRLVDHLKELVSEVQEDQRSTLHKLDANHEVILRVEQAANIVLVVHLIPLLV